MRPWVLPLCVVLADPLRLGGQSFDQARASLEAEFQDHIFTTKIALGNSHVFYHSDAKRNQMRRVDTEISPSGTIQYLAIWPNMETNGASGFGIFARAFYIGDMSRSRTFPAGQRVKVTKLDWRDDRLELWLSTVPGSDYGKFKFMFGKDFQKSATRQSMLTTIARALVLEDFERLQRAEGEYPVLLSQLEVAKLAYSSATGKARLQAAEELRHSLSELERNRAVKEQLTHDAKSAEAAVYAKAGAALDPDLNTLREEARAIRVQEIRSTMVTRGRDIDSLLSVVDTRKPARLDEWKEHESRLGQVQRLYGELAPLSAERTTLDQALSAEELALMTKQKTHFEGSLAVLLGQRQALERLQLDDDYKAMDRRLAVQRDTYTRAFGTTSFATEVGKCLTLLQQMLGNRVEAEKAGSKAAASQAAALAKEIVRTKQRLR